MRVVFAGTPAFAKSALEALLGAGHEVALVLTQPDRPAGRGMRPRSSEVKTLAVARGLPLAQPASLKSGEALELVRAANAQVMVVAAYGLILPPSLLDLCELGCINIHASLLPRWRGAAPVQRAILAGDEETGISIMRMEEGLDTGPVYFMRQLRIEPDDTAGSLSAKLAALGGSCIVEALADLGTAQLGAIPQSDRGVTYANKIEKQEAVIDWSRAAAQVERQVRAFNPFPVANTSWRGAPLRIWRARALLHQAGTAGRVIEVNGDGLLVECGSGALLVEELQRTGGRVMLAADFQRGAALQRGEILGQ